MHLNPRPLRRVRYPCFFGIEAISCCFFRDIYLVLFLVLVPDRLKHLFNLKIR